MTNWYRRFFNSGIAQTVLLGGVLLSAGPAFAGPAGEVVLATGEAWKIVGNAKQALERGQSVNEGETLQTGEGQLILRMVDGGLLSLRSNSTTTLTDYHLGHGDEAPAVRITIDQGVVRSSTGSIGESDKSKFRVNTPFSALGIRGTDFVTSVSAGVQNVYVVTGEIGLSPFAANCLAKGLGECAGSTALPASADRSLSLAKGQAAAVQVAGVPPKLLPIEAEKAFFKSEMAALVGDTTGDMTANYTSGKVYAADGTEIKPYDTSVVRSVYSHDEQASLAASPSSVELARIDYNQIVANDEVDRISDGLLLDRSSGDTDGDGVTDFAELQFGLNPWSNDTDKDGLLDAVDPAPRLPQTQYWFDGQASPVNSEVMRFALRDVSNTLSSFDFGGFGKAAFYRAKSSQSGSLSMWLDAGHGQLWGQSNVLSTLLGVRAFPESSTIWDGLPDQAANLHPGAKAWLQGVAKGEVSLDSLNLSDQSILFRSVGRDAEKVALPGQFELDFVQQLQAPSFGSSPLEIYQAPKFLSLGRDGQSFVLNYEVNGVKRTLVGSAGPGGVFFGADETFSLRGVKTDDSVLLMVSDGNEFQQWMLGYSLAGVEAAKVTASAFTSKADNGVTWGRWQNFANLTLEDMQSLLGPQVIANSRFAIMAKAAQSLPESGRFEFVLKDHEAVYSKGVELRPADVSNSFLQVDFGKSKFSTTFDVSAPGVSAVNVRGAGDITAEGLMRGDKGLSNAQLNGVLTDQGKGASVLFEKSLGEGEGFSGITHWAR